VDGLDNLEVLQDQRGRQPQRRLVHQQQAGPGHQGPAHRDYLLLAAGQRVGQPATPLEQAREQPMNHVEVLAERFAHAQHRAELQVLPHGQLA